MYDKLKAFKDVVELTEAPKEVVKEVQSILKLVKLYKGLLDGVAGQETLKALAAFKEAEYLAFPTKLGATTVAKLVEAVEDHPQVVDTPIPSSVKTLNIPGVSRIWANKPIYDNCAFTWGEATKSLTRLPRDVQTTSNIIKVARVLQELRDHFDRPITITSWYRDPVSNRAVGGVSNSRHLVGDAADIVVQGLHPHQAAKDIKKIVGNRGGVGDSDHFTHIDLRGYAARWNYSA